MKIAQAERITGLEIRGGALDTGPNLGPWSMISYTAFEKTDTGEKPYASVTARGSPASVLKKLVEEVYRTRAMQVRKEQGYRCFHSGQVGVPLEIDHIKKRSAGRDDRRENLRALGVEAHRRRHAEPKWNPEPHPRIRELMALVGLRWGGDGWEKINHG